MTRQVVRVVPASQNDWVRCRGGKERAFGRPRHTDSQVPAGPRFITTALRFGHAGWRRTVAARLVLRQPTDANLYAPSLNEAFEGDSHSRELQLFYFFFVLICLREAVWDATQTNVHGHLNFTVPSCALNLVAHCADTAGRIMSPHRRLPIRHSQTCASHVLPNLPVRISLYIFNLQFLNNSDIFCSIR